MLETSISALYLGTHGLNDMQIRLEGKVAVVTGVSSDGQVGKAV